MKHTRYVNFYPPCDSEKDPYPWRTTSWTTRQLADENAKRGRLAKWEAERAIKGRRRPKSADGQNPNKS